LMLKMGKKSHQKHKWGFMWADQLWQNDSEHYFFKLKN
jgi:hypothetical protein